MAPSARDLTSGLHSMASLQARRLCSSGYSYSNGYCYRSSRWSNWGRWVLAGVVIFFFLLFLLALSCRVRRQRRRGVQPTYGTSWMGFGQNHQQQQYNNTQGYAAPPPPEYSQQPYNNTGGTYNSNQGYYGQNTGTYNNDIPLQQPNQSYYPTRSAGADDYAPPEGPPPAKK